MILDPSTAYLYDTIRMNFKRRTSAIDRGALKKFEFGFEDVGIMIWKYHLPRLQNQDKDCPQLIQSAESHPFGDDKGKGAMLKGKIESVGMARVTLLLFV